MGNDCSTRLNDTGVLICKDTPTHIFTNMYVDMGCANISVMVDDYIKTWCLWPPSHTDNTSFYEAKKETTKTKNCDTEVDRYKTGGGFDRYKGSWHSTVHPPSVDPHVSHYRLRVA